MTPLKKLLIWMLTLQSRLILRKYKPFVVAVTGSVGKTSTKDAIYDVFKSPALCTGQDLCYVRKSEKSLNSEIGLPLTVIGVPNAWRNMAGWMRNIKTGFRLIFKKNSYPDCLILEVGADHPDDIRKVARWLRPDIAVITKVSRTPVHVEFFDSPEQVFEEKASLAEAVKPGGTVVLFADDGKVMSIAERLKDNKVNVISFGTSASATVRGSSEKIIYEGMESREWKVESGTASDGFHIQPSTFHPPVGISFNLELDGASAPVTVKNVLGKVYLYPLLAAAATGKARGMSIDAIAMALNGFEAPKGRLNIIPGINETILIDDTYNSSPDAALAALEALKAVEHASRKIAVLGDMMELGKYSAEEHRRIGREAAAVADILITVGPRSHVTAEEALKSGMKQSAVMPFDSTSEAAESLKSILKPGDVVLIKGSQSVRMERVVKALMREPSKAAELLVRQEKEWLEKK